MKIDDIINDIIDSIENDIEDRNGIGDEWDEIDTDIKEEIKQEWKEIINNNFKKAKAEQEELIRILKNIYSNLHCENELFYMKNEIKDIIKE